MTNVTLQVADRNFALSADILPPVGTKMTVHKHFYDGGTAPTIEIIEHEWWLDDSGREDGGYEFSVMLKTRIIDP